MVFCKDCKYMIMSNAKYLFKDNQYICSKSDSIVEKYHPITGKKLIECDGSDLCIYKNENCDCSEFEEKEKNNRKGKK